METFDEYVGGGEEVPQAAGSRPFDDDGYIGYDPRLPSQRFESFHMTPEGSYSEADHGAYSEADHDESKELDADFTSSNIHHGSNNGFDPLGGGGPDVPPPFHQSAFDDDSQQSPPFGQSYQSSPVPDFALGGSAADSIDEFPPSSVGSNGKGFHQPDVDGAFGFPPTGFLNGSGSVLPPPEEMQPEEGFILREWKRMNAIRLEEKARNEREALSQIIDEADAFKDKFYEKRRTHCETNKKNNRDKEKVFLENQETFHANADKHYWKAVAELIPHELPSKEVKSRGKDKKKPSVIINQGPKPGKATDLTRMRQVLVKLKHNPPAHMKAPVAPPPAAPSGEGPDAKPAPPAEPAPPQRQGSIQANAGA